LTKGFAGYGRWKTQEYYPLAAQDTKVSRKTTSLLVLAVLALAALVAFYLRYGSGTPELRVGATQFAPYVMVAKDGGVSGLAVDVVNEAAKRAGITLKYIPMGIDIDAALSSGKIDLFPLLTLTPHRTRNFHASRAWWTNEISLISLDSARVQGTGDSPGKRIAIRGMPIVKILAERIFPRAQLVTIPALGPMIAALCDGQVNAVFIDAVLLQSQMLQGPPACVNRPLYVSSIPEGQLLLGTIARRQSADLADRIYEQIANLAIDGTLSKAASSYSVISSAQNRNMKEILDAQRRASLLRFGLGGLTLMLIVSGIQTHRMRRSRAVAEESRQRFDAFMKHTPALTFIKDEAGRVVYINQERGENTLLEEQPQYLASQLQELDSTVLRTNRSFEVTETVPGSAGESRHFLCLKFPFSGTKGPRFLGTVALDVTERKRADEALRFSQFSIDRAPDPILWIDSNARIFYANDSAEQKFGYPKEELLRMRFMDIDCGFGSLACVRRIRELKSGGSMTLESYHRTKSGKVFPVELSLNYLELEGRGFVCCMGRDITERKHAERELSHQAQHDQLTGLPNRRFFETRLEHCIEAAALTDSGLAVLYFDLDGFKLINDTHGHSLGDTLLKQCVRRIQGSVRETDILARMGGDEFTLIATGVDGRERATEIAEKLLSSLANSFIIDGHELLVTASLGISLYPFDGADGNTLLRHADAAMYEAKREGKNRMRFFSPEMNTKVRERLELENHLRRALERNELVLHYQPEISMRSNELIRNEALLRWNHPSLGLISPAKFIPIAEETGLIIPIGNWVLEEACRQTKKLCDSGLRAGVGVNVSSVQFSRPDYVQTVTDVLHRTGLSPLLLELELTESVVMQGVEDVAGKIRELRTLGISVSIDDFGTGYSSLSYLQKLRIDNLKIDRSFIRDVPCDPDALALTKALVSLAHSLGMKVVMEGIETRQQLEAIRGIGCDIGQGFLLGRPEPMLEVPELILAETA
jgi:diguanylate cyclase (GGDEF)-like protein/PAS domain S-box-containing protein